MDRRGKGECSFSLGLLPGIVIIRRRATDELTRASPIPAGQDWGPVSRPSWPVNDLGYLQDFRHEQLPQGPQWTVRQELRRGFAQEPRPVSHYNNGPRTAVMGTSSRSSPPRQSHGTRQNTLQPTNLRPSTDKTSLDSFDGLRKNLSARWREKSAQRFDGTSEVVEGPQGPEEYDDDDDDEEKVSELRGRLRALKALALSGRYPKRSSPKMPPSPYSEEQGGNGYLDGGYQQNCMSLSSEEPNSHHHQLNQHRSPAQEPPRQPRPSPAWTETCGGRGADHESTLSGAEWDRKIAQMNGLLDIWDAKGNPKWEEETFALCDLGHCEVCGRFYAPMKPGSHVCPGRAGRHDAGRGGPDGEAQELDGRGADDGAAA